MQLSFIPSYSYANIFMFIQALLVMIIFIHSIFFFLPFPLFSLSLFFFHFFSTSFRVTASLPLASPSRFESLVLPPISICESSHFHFLQIMLVFWKWFEQLSSNGAPPSLACLARRWPQSMASAVQRTAPKASAVPRRTGTEWGGTPQ